MDKNLPWSLEAEQSVIGGMLINPDIIPMVKNLLSIDDFYLEKHQEIYKSIISTKDPDLITIWNNIDKEKVDKKYYYSFTDVTTSAGWKTHVQIILRDSKKRKLWVLGREISEESALYHSDIESILSDAKNGLSAIEKNSIPDEISNEQLAMNTYKGIFEKKEPGLYTGVQGIDKRFYFENGYIHCIAAESGVGKSALSLQILNYIAQSQDKDALFYSLESTNEKLVRRWLCRETSIPLTAINKCDFKNDGQIEDIQNACNNFSISKLKLFDNSNLVYIEKLISHIESYYLNNDVSIVCIDFLQALDSLKSFSSDRSKINYFISRIKSLAKELNIPVVYTCQLRKDINGRPKLDDLIESNYIRTHTDNILFLYAPDSDPVVYSVECFLAKGKDQERFSQWLEFNGNYQIFYKGEKPLEMFKKKKNWQDKI